MSHPAIHAQTQVDDETMCVTVTPAQESHEVRVVMRIACVACAEGDTTAPPAVPENARAHAIARLVLVDAEAATRLAAGDAVFRLVPVERPRPPVVFFPDDTAHAYRAGRASISDLLRPLLGGPPDLGRLYPYQREGAGWLEPRRAAILADDMGLGKTVQAISALRVLIHEGHCADALVIAPKSLTATWRHELATWAPELAVCQLAPTSRQKDLAWRLVLGRHHIYITHYEHMREPPDVVLQRTFGAIVLDEAHRTRRAVAVVTQTIRRLRASRWWALSGTPLERDSEDFVTLLSTMIPGRFAPSDHQLAPAVLARRARPYVLRRLKADVLPQLPPVTESVQWVELGPRQREAYDEIRERTMSAQADPGALLKGINEMRSVCDVEPASGESSKLDRVVELLGDIGARHEKAVVFSYLLAPLAALRARLGASTAREVVQVDGTMAQQERDTVLQAFRAPAGPSVLLASSRVASEGLTLVEANHVIFVNEWWNPSSNQQARDRVVRIGQERHVHVYRFRAEHTIEEALHHLLARKQDLFDDVVGVLSSSRPPVPAQLRLLVELL